MTGKAGQTSSSNFSGKRSNYPLGVNKETWVGRRLNVERCVEDHLLVTTFTGTQWENNATSSEAATGPQRTKPHCEELQFDSMNWSHSSEHVGGK